MPTPIGFKTISFPSAPLTYQFAAPAGVVATEDQTGAYHIVAKSVVQVTSLPAATYSATYTAIWSVAPADVTVNDDGSLSMAVPPWIDPSARFFRPDQAGIAVIYLEAGTDIATILSAAPTDPIRRGLPESVPAPTNLNPAPVTP